MAKHKSESTEYIPKWDDGTYHTGSAKPHKEHRGLIAVLMILVIFLGGLASALGLLNVRLLQEIAQFRADAKDVPLYEDKSSTDFHLAESDDASAPSLPNAKDWDLPLEAPEKTTIPAADILHRNDDALVSIHCGSPDSEAVACGVIVDESGYLLTNAYPVSDSGRIYVQLSDGQIFRASVVGIDEFTDLAVLYIEAAGLTAAEFAATDTLKERETIIFIGTDRQMRQGSISTKDSVYTVGSDALRLLETDLPGISGPIFNACGQMIGFCSPFLSENTGAMAIPSAIVKEVAEQIIRNGTISGRPSLGAQLEEVLPVHQQYWQLPQGLRVTDTGLDESLSTALEPGDILIQLGGQSITDRESLCAVLRQLRAGDRVEAIVVRGNETITLTLIIQASGNQKE